MSCLYSLLLILALIVGTPFSSTAKSPAEVQKEAANGEERMGTSEEDPSDLESPPDESSKPEVMQEDTPGDPKEDKQEDSSEGDKPITAAEEGREPAEYSRPVIFREKTVFRLYAETEDGKKEIITRAQKASRAMEKAMTASEPLRPEAKLVETSLTESDQLIVRIRGYKVLSLDENDQKASGFKTMADYEEQVSIDFNAFVSKEYNRVKIQKLALQFFLSVFFALMGFVVFRKVRSAFNQADLMIEKKRESLKPFVFLSENLISGQTLGGLLALFLVLGRVLAYFVVVLTTVAAISGQFRLTRNIMSDFFSQVVAQTFKSFQSLLESIPGLFLAATLLFFLYLSLKILNLFLKGVRSGRISWGLLMGDRIPVVQFWGTVLLCTLFAPLVIASIFGGFHTPLEIVGLIIAAVVGLSALPTLVSIATGSYILWQGNLRPGQWVRIGDQSGEITEIALHKMIIVPEAGGRIHIPMIQLLYMTCYESKETPRKEYRFTVIRETDLDSCLKKVGELFKEAGSDVTVKCHSISSKEYFISLQLADLNHESQIRVYKTLADAQDKGQIQLSNQPVEELHF